MCTDDLPASVALYRDVFGFADAGGDVLSGPQLASTQGLGDDASCILWWMVGRQEFTQLEFFTHTLPRQRPLDPSWRPCDLGWVRWGIAVADFDAVQARLADRGIDPIAAPIVVAGLRRLCFRDPYVGTVVEVMEEGQALPGGIRPRHRDLEPALAYAALSVQDLDVARKFYVDTLGLVEIDAELHPPESEATWNLPGAVREAMVLRADNVLLEIVRYAEPVGRRHHDRRLSDQGLMNVAIGFRDRERLGELYDRIREGGYRILTPLTDTATAVTYVEDGEGNSVEILSMEPELDSRFGFAPR